MGPTAFATGIESVANQAAIIEPAGTLVTTPDGPLGLRPRKATGNTDTTMTGCRRNGGASRGFLDFGSGGIKDTPSDDQSTILELPRLRSAFLLGWYASR